MTQDKIKNKIEELYIQYCKFANITNPAQMNIQYIKDINPYVELGNPSTMGINPRLFKLPNNRILPTIYHEFTHLNDYNMYCLSEPIFDRKMIVLLYTEIHATIIEMQIATGFRNTNDDIFLTMEDRINSINGKETLKTYINKGDKILGKSINSFIQDKTKSKFIRFIKELGYAIGRKNFVETYTESKILQFNLSKAVETFGLDIETIIHIGSQDNISENDMIHMTNLWGELMLKLAN